MIIVVALKRVKTVRESYCSLNKETFYIFQIYKEILIKPVYSGDSLNGDYCR